MGDQKHLACGLCSACYHAERKHGLRICDWCSNPNARRSFGQHSYNLVLCSLKCKKELYEKILAIFRTNRNIASTAKQLGLGEGMIVRITREMGLYTNRFVRRHFGSISTIRDMDNISGEAQYFTDEKQLIRELMAEETARALQFPLQLVCLPHVNIVDVAEFAKWCEIKLPESLAVEKNRKWFNMISSWVNAAHLLPDGRVIQGLRLYNGYLSKALVEVPGRYNCANLDFDGCLSKEVYESLENLFAYQRLTEDAVVFVTLSDHVRFLHNPKTNRRITMPQGILVPIIMQELAEKTGYHSESLWNDGMRYKENTPSPMLTLAFRIRKIKEVERDDDINQGTQTKNLWYPEGSYRGSGARSIARIG